MVEGVLNPSKILLTTDFSESAACAYPYAAALARRHGSELVVLNVITGHSKYVEDSEYLQAYERKIAEQVAQRLEKLVVAADNNLPVRKEIASAWSAKEGMVDSMGRCNTMPSPSNIGGANGSTRKTGTVCCGEEGVVASLAIWGVAKRHRPRSGKTRWVNPWCRICSWRDFPS